MATLPSKTESSFADAVIETLGHADPQRGFQQIAEPDDVDFGKIPLTAVMSLHGETVAGHVVLATSAELLRLTNPIKDAPSGKEDAYARDWLGELLNLVVGQFKRKMVGHGTTFQVSPPSFQHYVRTSGMVLEEFGPVRYEEDGLCKDLWFTVGKHPCVFQLGIKPK